MSLISGQQTDDKIVLALETDEEGLAKWPLSFTKIEKDFKRPNKPGNPDQEPKAKDSQKPDTKDQPYQMTTAPSKGLTKG